MSTARHSSCANTSTTDRSSFQEEQADGSLLVCCQPKAWTGSSQRPEKTQIIGTACQVAALLVLLLLQLQHSLFAAATCLPPLQSLVPAVATPLAAGWQQQQAVDRRTTCWRAHRCLLSLQQQASWSQRAGTSSSSRMKRKRQRQPIQTCQMSSCRLRTQQEMVEMHPATRPLMMALTLLRGQQQQQHQEHPQGSCSALCTRCVTLPSESPQPTAAGLLHTSQPPFEQQLCTH